MNWTSHSHEIDHATYIGVGRHDLLAGFIHKVNWVGELVRTIMHIKPLLHELN